LSIRVFSFPRNGFVSQDGSDNPVSSKAGFAEWPAHERILPEHVFACNSSLPAIYQRRRAGLEPAASSTDRGHSAPGFAPSHRITVLPNLQSHLDASDVAKNPSMVSSSVAQTCAQRHQSRSWSSDWAMICARLCGQNVALTDFMAWRAHGLAWRHGGG